MEDEITGVAGDPAEALNHLDPENANRASKLVQNCERSGSNVPIDEFTAAWMCRRRGGSWWNSCRIRAATIGKGVLVEACGGFDQIEPMKARLLEKFVER